MSTSHWFPAKDPQEKLSYRIDWSRALAVGDTIASVTWTVPSPLVNEAASNTTTTATLTLSGGTAGTDPEVLCHIVTTLGAIYERTVTIPVREL